jgi:hypothetical protein
MRAKDPSTFDQETLGLMGRVCDDALDSLQATTTFQSPAEEQEARTRIAARVMSAVTEGERDAERLLAVALGRDSD